MDLVSGSNHNTVIGSNKFILPSIYDRVSKQCTGTNSTKAPAVVTTDSNGYCSICSSSGNAALFGGQQLNSLSSANRITASGYTLTMQTDGNLVLKNSTGFAIFASNTWQGNGPYSMTLNMQVIDYY